MEKSFPEFYDYYLSVINDNSHQNGQNMMVSTEHQKKKKLFWHNSSLSMTKGCGFELFCFVPGQGSPPP